MNEHDPVLLNIVIITSLSATILIILSVYVVISDVLRDNLERNRTWRVFAGMVLVSILLCALLLYGSAIEALGRLA